MRSSNGIARFKDSDSLDEEARGAGLDAGGLDDDAGGCELEAGSFEDDSGGRELEVELVEGFGSTELDGAARQSQLAFNGRGRMTYESIKTKEDDQCLSDRALCDGKTYRQKREARTHAAN